jgi:flagellar basal-body rod modification protein FlgD
MSTPPVSSTPGTVYDPKTGKPQSASANKDRDNFLLLLTTQLKNQDPTNPTDTNQVTQQIALLSQVEQQTKSNQFLEKLVNMFTLNQAQDAVGYIGRQVDAAGSKGELADGKASFVYTLPAGVDKATVNIFAPDGRLVYSGNGTTIAGRNTVIWDGSNSVTGATMPEGAYTFQVKAVDLRNKEVEATTLSTGIVRAVETKEGVNSLSLGSFSIPLDSIISVYNPPIISPAA